MDTLYKNCGEYCMYQVEFRNEFMKNHEYIVNDLCEFLEVGIDDINNMLKKSYIVLAGGYVRRLYMVKNKIDLDPRDMEAYINSDLDMFVLSGALLPSSSIKNKYTNMISDSSTKPSFSNISASDVSSFGMSIYVGTRGNDTPSSDMCSNLKFKPLVKRMQHNVNISDTNRPYMFYKGTQVMETCVNALSVFNIWNVSRLGTQTPNIQFIKISKTNLKKYARKTNLNEVGAYAYSKVLVSSFDLSQTKMFIENISTDVNECDINVEYAHTQDVYNCDISEHMMNNINMFQRIRKYASIGGLFDKEQISKLLKSDTQRTLSTGVIEGGYY